ncbi:LamG-like jellyroll fold domain-containing protein [Rubrimonas cliftonensis]|uniref:Concanavalin A-like lectin/glucanases superfamily protein n=1 Tax=Rubrimonas cliftonensis TaxID=89524 RepID=A0A1H4BQY9_9RHOB|nr:LamG-like jellyroll fold domain-containing protein [Rubrimonas cliftonensis]SEA50490.1 Concanavalin A-like lectin/glucanases superfamily protein [Rubrimonas cliftonensis]
MVDIVSLDAKRLAALAQAPTDILAAPASTSAGGYLVRPAGLSGVIESYTLVYDLHVAAGVAGAYNGLFQSDLSNSGDSDLFMRRDGEGETFGVGISGDYPGGAAYGAWHRIAFSLASDGVNVTIRRFIDGVFVGEIVKEAGRYAFDAAQGFLILTDNDGETMPTALAAFAFVPEALSDDAIAALGEVDGMGVASGVPGALEFGFGADGFAPSIGAGEMTPRTPAEAGDFVAAGGDEAPEPGRDKHVLRFEATDATGGYLLKPALAGDATSFSLVYDLAIDAGSPGYGGLFQTAVANDNDGDLFLRQLVGGEYGVGISGQYEGAIEGGAWARIAFTFADNGDGSSTLVKFIDGVKVGQQTVDTARFTIDAETGFQILTDNDGETFGGHLANFAFTARTLSADEVAGLGGATTAPLPASVLGDGAVIFDFEGGAASGDIPARGGEMLTDLSFDPASELTPDLALAYEADGPDGGYRVETALDAAVESFTLFFDLMLDEGDLGRYGALLQLGLANAEDGELFLKVNGEGGYGVGISGDYVGDLRPGAWARLGFSVEANGDGSSRLAKFIDGVKVGEQTVETARFTIDPSGFLILADNDGETFSGKLASFALLDRAMDDAEIEALGGASPGGALGAAGEGETLVAFDFIADAKVVNGSTLATIGAARLIDRDFVTVELTEEIVHQLVTVGGRVEIDLAEVFSGENLVFTLEGGNEQVRAAIEDGKLIVTGDALGFADLTVTATDDLGNSATDSFRIRAAGENAYTIVVFPDTQNYTNDGSGGRLYRMTEWVADNAAGLKIAAVTHVGDVTGDNRVHEWANVSEAYALLEQAGIPYTLLPGNHDQSDGGKAADHSSNIDLDFGLDRYFAQHEGGVYEGDGASIRNNYKLFTAPDGTDWIVVSLEFGVRDDAVAWADEVLSEHADRRAIVLTHHYTNMADIAGPRSGSMYAEGTGKDYGMKDSVEAVNDGRDLWDALVSRHGNISFVFSGHVFGDGVETIVRYGEQGNAVAQMLVNYQDGVAVVSQTAGDDAPWGNGGNGAMRLIVIDPDNDRVDTETYYTELDTYMTAGRGEGEPSRDGPDGPVDPVVFEPQTVAFGTTAEVGLAPLPDGDAGAGVIATPRYDPNNGLLIDPGFAPASGGTNFLAYTMVWDMFLPAEIGLIAIIQTDPSNLNDGDLWLQMDANGGGLYGAAAQDDGPFPLDGWRRIVAVMTATDETGSAYRLDKYVDGVLIGTQVFSGDRRAVKDGGFLIFADDNFETPSGSGLSSFAFVEKALTAEEVAALGGVTADGPFAAAPDGVNGVQFDFENGDLAPSFGTGSMTQYTRSPDTCQWTPSLTS